MSSRTPPAHPPEAPETTLWDVVVVGTGMGGSAAGLALAERGFSVLFLEKGHFLQLPSDAVDQGLISGDDRPEQRLRRGWWPTPITGETTFGKQTFFAPLGCGTGGSSSLYAAQLERLMPCDFEPRRNHPEGFESTLPEAWPITYPQLEPYYQRAEQLFHVTGTPDPLHREAKIELQAPPPLGRRDQALFDFFRDKGMHPYRPHVGCRYLPGCEGCGAMICPRLCKADAGMACLLPALQQQEAKLLTECEVVGLAADRRTVQRVHCRWRGREIRITAKVVILAAGAYMTPALLLRSNSKEWPDGLANDSQLVGRNLMLHTSDFVAIRPYERLPNDGPNKAVALNDFYLREGQKLGTFQSVGIPVTPGYILHHLRNVTRKQNRWWRPLAAPFLRPIAHAAGLLYRHAAMFATIVEDLPYADNRVVLDPSTRSGIRFHYTYRDELRRRNQFYRRMVLSTFGLDRAAYLSSGDNLNYGHVCGTCRFGDDPTTSVLDASNRAHGLDNLYVVDASFFPSSGGTNPSLTIAANALRVGQIIADRLR